MTLFDLDAIGAGLVISSARHDLENAVRTGAMVVTAPPGTGKTTYVAPLVANLLGNSAGRVLMTQPRRVAVRAAATRIATLDGTAMGELVGFTVRGERRMSSTTRIEVLTPGVLLRRVLNDPGLEGTAAVILDEVHERSLDGDLLLALLAEIRELRPDLVVVAMSATVDTALITGVLDGASVVQVDSALHELTTIYAPFERSRLDDRGVTREYLAHVADTTATAVAQNQCDALVFLPGVREVDEVARLLRQRFEVLQRASPRPIEVLTLHGRASPREQDMAVSGNKAVGSTRIVASTALAESSLTVPGVRLVIDAGLSREPRRDQLRDMMGLVTVSASRASAEQRAGRAARVGPGRVVRAYSETDFAHMPQSISPEINQANLTDAALLLAAWGTPRGEGLRLPTAPPARAMAQAERELQRLELVDAQGRITKLGKTTATLPIGAREARALIQGAKLLGDAREAAEIIAAISDDHRTSSADLRQLLRDLRAARTPAASRWRREADRLTRIAREHLSASGSESLQPGESPGLLVALTRPEWVARRTSSHARTYLLASGTRAALPEGSSLLTSDWLAVREVQRASGRVAAGTGAIIRLAAPIQEPLALSVAAPLLQRTRISKVEQGRVRVRENRQLGAITLASTPLAASEEDRVTAFLAELRANGLGLLHWNDDAITLQARLGLLHRMIGDPWPNTSDEALIARLSEWLEPDITQLRSDDALTEINVERALKRLLPWPEAIRLDELVPERLAVQSGSRIRITYPSVDDSVAKPVLAVKLQEVFGMSETPRLVDGRVPILMHLLSPAGRPLAVTDDLSSFWNGPYHQVRTEMRGRYPKHPWPENPWSAQATARTKRAMNSANR